MTLISKLAREYKAISLKCSGINPFLRLKHSGLNPQSPKNLFYNASYPNHPRTNSVFNDFFKFDSPSPQICPDHLRAGCLRPDYFGFGQNISISSTYSCKNKTIRLALRKKRKRLGERVSLRYR